MYDTFTSGTWTTNPGSDDAFVEAWTAFATWGSTSEAPGRCTLSATSTSRLGSSASAAGSRATPSRAGSPR